MAELRCSDGTVVPVSEETEKELRKAFESKPQHVWEHGDVFESGGGVQIYLEPDKGPMTCVLERAGLGGTPHIQLNGATFLFNIKDKL